MGHHEGQPGADALSVVTLVSGGLDSTVMSILAAEENLVQYPLFIDYGQLARDRELAACRLAAHRHRLPGPAVLSVAGYGNLISSGLTDVSRDLVQDAFLPGRNLMFLTLGAAYAVQRSAGSVAIGLLDEAFSLFPDQTKPFLSEAESLLSRTMDQTIRIVAPLMSFSKGEVLSIASARGVTGTYSCHRGEDIPCGDCVACREYNGLEV